ncbi:hypothetical protein CRUP_031221 [Coryphaenoides rupestris]|nr:hypothetical protein CRUP_031221 [Coryphaenoides rupestris]
MVDQLKGRMVKMENFQKLLELKKDLIGIDNLVIPGRVRLSQQVVWERPPATSLSEMERWMEDIKVAIDMAAESSDGPTADLLTSPIDNKFPEDSSAEAESEDDTAEPRGSVEKPAAHRANTTVHVCWHRNSSVSMMDFSVAVELTAHSPGRHYTLLPSPNHRTGPGPVPVSLICWYRVQSHSFSESCRSLENQLSGNLLRKFKNSNGWQKLWVVFTNFSLFFYKTHQDDYPLASLPLLGYSVTIPSEAENIHKDYVFKLHFKSHIYYFRSESEYTFERWMEVIRSATVPSSRTRIQNRKIESRPH